jgi:Dynamin family
VSHLVEKFQEYSNWRTSVMDALERYLTLVDKVGLSDIQSDECIARVRAGLVDDKLRIAFVAEFSRGKSELINAIFFTDYGQRILPSSAGRTTMCPTELLYDAAFTPSIRLLPIETRALPYSIADFKARGHGWTTLPLDISSGDGMMDAFRQVSMTKRVSVEEAKGYGLYDEADITLATDARGQIEIPQWRHAIVNFPHPLLKQGLVIIDTPGLNAIGTEPELTLNLIPNAHAVLFILAADTGVTKSDIEVWRQHIGTGPGRMVVLNKIDSMWDELRSPAEVEHQISMQVASVAQILGVSEQQVFPVSAQKGLVGKINCNADMLAKSRLSLLENALSSQLLLAKQNIIRSRLMLEINTMTATKQGLLVSRIRNVIEQLFELKSLRGKNQKIIAHMKRRINIEKQDFDVSLFTLQATRAVFGRLSTDVFKRLSLTTLEEDIRKTRETMEKSFFSSGLRQAIKHFFVQIQESLALSGQKTDEIGQMMTVMYRKFSSEHGLTLSTPMPFSLQKYSDDIAVIESVYQKQFSTAIILTTSQVVLMKKFFDSITSRVMHSFLQANRDMEAWLQAIMAPLEAQIVEHKSQLKQRVQSIERIHLATDTLEEKVTVFEKMQIELEAQKNILFMQEAELKQLVAAETGSQKAPV